MFKEKNHLLKLPLNELLKYKYIILFFIVYNLYFLIFHYGETNCIIQLTFGIPCMGCGMSRAFYYLITFNFKEAFFFHPLIYIMPFIIVVILYNKITFFSKLYNSKIFWGVIVLLFVIVYVVRMILYFPHTEPMDFYENPFIIKLLIR